jgi:phosphoribosylaminoimidazolecarboxamide formyltransferase/IMP cyclohydrolase
MKLVEEIDNLVPVRTVLASVFFKEGIENLVKGLVERCPRAKIISTGGTYSAIRQILGKDADNKLMMIEQYTGDPEIAGGLVKSLGYAKSLGLLTNTYWPEHQEALAQRGVAPIDVVVCNFYPFEQAVADRDATPEAARSNMDIGGPTMTNEAAKNMLRVAVLTSHSQYGDFLEDLARNQGSTSLEFRLKCAKDAFTAIARDAFARGQYWCTVTAEQLAGCYKVNERAK